MGRCYDVITEKATFSHPDVRLFVCEWDLLACAKEVYIQEWCHLKQFRYMILQFHTSQARKQAHNTKAEPHDTSLNLAMSKKPKPLKPNTTL